jgi:muramoyltetrapeptide carboxypeptidase
VTPQSESAPTSRLRWPRPLRPGGTVGICAPSGPVGDVAVLDAAVDLLRSRGYEVVVAPHTRHLHPHYPYLAGTDDERVADLNALLADPTIDLILCARGGYGAMRLLDRVDYDAARRDPKPLVGYSDITTLQLALAARAGIVSFSGIMATAGSGLGEPDLDPFSEASLWAAVGAINDETGGASFVLSSPPDAEPWRVIRPPTANATVVSGPVYPVCLTLLVALVGTAYLPDLRGAILVIEDVHEELYAVDRYLVQLRLAGVLDSVAAVLVGSFNGETDEENLRLRSWVPQLVCEMTPAHVAVAAGVAYGHIPRRLCLPVGATAIVDLAAGTFCFDRSG